MQVDRLELDGVLLLTPMSHADARGLFAETYRRDNGEIQGPDLEFVQENFVVSGRAGTVRGLHFQIPPHAQAKLVCVVSGAILDVVVDLRASSPTFGEHLIVELRGDRLQELFVPEGFAHGYCTLEPDSRLTYKTTAYYAPEHEKGLIWNDPALCIKWPVEDGAAILSERDRSLPRLADLPEYFA